MMKKPSKFNELKGNMYESDFQEGMYWWNTLFKRRPHLIVDGNVNCVIKNKTINYEENCMECPWLINKKTDGDQQFIMCQPASFKR